MLERTVVIFKPDAVERGLVGEILSRFEKVGLRIVGAKVAKVDKEFIGTHYPNDEDYLRRVGEKTIQEYRDGGLDPRKELDTLDPLALGQRIRELNMKHLTEGSVVAFVLEGPHAISVVRKLVGALSPAKSAPGTIRGDYSSDSAFIANKEKRSIRNLIHASGDRKEAEAELKLWFKDEELL